MALKVTFMNRVVITGLGLLAPIGVGKEQFWNNLIAGTSGITPVTAFDTSAFPVHLGAEVKDFDAQQYCRRSKPEELGRASQLAIAAARLAIHDAHIELRNLDPNRVGVSMGTTSGEPLFVEQYNDIRKAQGLEAIPGEIMPKYPCNVIPTNIAIEFELHGPCLMIPTACAAGNYAIGYGYDVIRAGRADLMLAGGADAFSRITYMGFARLGAIAPERCQPFDKNRKGMVPGEGAAVLILEPRDSALARGAHIYAEVLGYGLSCDSHHMTAAHPEGDGAVRAMASALKESGVTIEDVDYISAHGTGTPTNDRVESIAVRRLFGKQAERVPISSIKSMIGHTMGAASAIEAVACALAIDTGIIPPTINYESPDPECDLDYVANQARRTDPSVVLNNAYAFGGNNASLCLARLEG
jgi:3-oxoacyl-[acyl-carrier-protein] synthase II